MPNSCSKPDPTAPGPFDTAAEALAAAGVAVGQPIPAGNRRLLLGALEAARVTLGRYDTAIIDWLTMYEAGTCAVIAGLITRAYQAGPDQRGG